LWPRTAGAPAGQSLAAAPDDEQAPKDALFAGDPVVRVLAADAIGWAPWPAGRTDRDRTEKLRIGALLEAMAGDRYPAVRHVAARALKRVLGTRPRWTTGAGVYDATASAADRDRAIGELRGRLSCPSPAGPEAEHVAFLRARARAADIEIGE
jgi:hypothetical protein